MPKAGRLTLNNFVIIFGLIAILVFAYLFERQTLYQAVKSSSNMLIQQEVNYYEQQVSEWSNTLQSLIQSRQTQQYLKALNKGRNIFAAQKKLSTAFNAVGKNKLNHIDSIRFIHHTGVEKIVSHLGKTVSAEASFSERDFFRETKVTPIGKQSKAQFEKINGKLFMYLSTPVGVKNKRLGVVTITIDIERVVSRYDYLLSITAIDSIVFFNRQGIALFNQGSDSLVAEEAAKVYELMTQNNLRNTYIEHNNNIWRYVKNDTNDFGVLLLTKSANITQGLNTGYLKLVLFFILVMVIFLIYRPRSPQSQTVETIEESVQLITEQRSHHFSVISDEIRHPINSLIGSLSTLSETSLDALQKQYTDTAKQSAFCLFELVNQFQDYAKISKDEFQLEKIDFDLRSTLFDIVEMLTPEADKKNLDIACLINADIPKRVTGDVTRLRQVMMNLISYAIRHTDSGEISVSLSADGENNALKYINIDIADTGNVVGEETLMQQIMQFSQVDFNEEGTCSKEGLGLALSKALIDLMSGEISAFDNTVGGNTFRVRFPYPVVKVRKQKKANVKLSGKRVLIVGEVDSNQQVMTQLFTQWHMPCTALSDFERVMNVLRDAVIAKQPYDVCLIDVSHSSSTHKAFDTARSIRQEFTPETLALIILTAQGVPGDAANAKTRGVQAYLTKPIDVKLMKLTMQSVVNETSEDSQSLFTKHSLREAETEQATRVLLMDKVPSNRLILENHFKQLKIVLDVTTDISQVEAVLSQSHYDLIFVNATFPGLDVCLFIETYRKEEALLLSQNKTDKKTSIVVLVNQNNASITDAFLENGADEEISYPFNELTFSQSVDKLLSL